MKKIIRTYLAILCLLPASSVFANMTLSSVAENGDSDSFEAILNEASGNPNVGVVLMHGRTSQPDGPVVNQLRNALASAGYTTLSIENPHALSNDSGQREFQDYVTDVQGVNYAFPEAYARVRAAINHLATLGIEKVVLAGMSMGSRFTAAHIENGQIDELPIVGYIGVGMYATSIDPLNHSMTLDGITIPVLDIYGDVDTNAVNTAGLRAAAYAGNASDYTVKIATCAAGTTNECHQLNGAKSDSGDACEFLEKEAINWITSVVPLSQPQGLGVCATSTVADDDSSSSSSGLAINPLIGFLILCFGFFRIFSRR